MTVSMTSGTPVVRTSLRAKLVKTMVITLVIVASGTLSVVVAMNVFSSNKTLSRIEGHLRASIEDKGRGLVTSQSLSLRDLVADNAFGDVTRLVQRTIEKDGDLIYGLFVDQDEKPWAFVANPRLKSFPKDWHALAVEHGPSLAKQVSVTQKVVGGESVFEFVLPVIDDKGERLGVLAYGFSDASLRAALGEAREDSRRTLTWTVVMLVVLGASAIVLGMALSKRSAARITRPVGDLTSAVKELAAGRRDIRVSIASGDELETLGGAFNNMASELADSYDRLEGMNRTLEHKVEERTAELGQRNRDMRLVLDNVDQGFLTISRDGILAVERSGIVDKWFGGYDAGTAFFDYIKRVDENYAISFRMGLEAILDDFLPLELTLDQMPARLRQAGREYRCRYFPIMRDDAFAGLLLVVNDVTSELLHSRQEAERKEILATFEGLSRDRSGFLAFTDEATDMVHQLPTLDAEGQKRVLHTLKGNAGLVGFTIVANLAHEMEDILVEQGAPLSAEALAPLTNRWQVITTSLTNFIGERGREVLELDAKEVERVVDMLNAGKPTPHILDRLASWWLEGADVPLKRLGRYAAVLCRRLGKGNLELEVQSNGIRLAPKAWAGFWTDLVHVIRNAIDHGIEMPDERRALGKPETCHLRLTTRLDKGNRLLVEIQDDGRGLDWKAIRAVAQRRGLPHETEAQLVAAIFTSGVSTRAEVTSLSGRGVGLAAVKHQVDDLGGSISVETTPGKGSTFRFTFVLPEVGPRFGIDVEPTAVQQHAA